MKRLITVLTALLLISSLFVVFSIVIEGTSIEKTDVVVIGAGGAGMAAAITARDKGAEVIVLEKMPVAGGNTFRSTGGINAAGTEQQKALGIEDSAELFYEDTMKSADYKSNPELVGILASKSADAVKWLGSLGAKLTAVHRSGGASADRSHGPEGGTPIGAYIVPILKKTVDDKGISLRLWHKATEILTDKEGNVSGVRAVNKEGKEYTIKAKSVVLATGGFGANLEMVFKYNPSLKGFLTTNHPGATGDGIDMALKLGAKLVDMDKIQIHPTTVPGNGFMISEVICGNGAILVNHEGKRFIDEMSTRDVMSKELLSLPEKTAFIIFDDGIRKRWATTEEYFKSGFVAEGDTIEDLAAKIKVSPENLSATIKSYNKSVEVNKDAEFHRTYLPRKIDSAKYYAIEVTPGIHYTMGGVKINAKTEVIGEGDRPIKNLYAAGEVTGGIHGGNRLGSNAVADIIVFGRIAGENAANNALGK